MRFTDWSALDGVCNYGSDESCTAKRTLPLLLTLQSADGRGDISLQVRYNISDGCLAVAWEILLIVVGELILTFFTGHRLVSQGCG